MPPYHDGLEVFLSVGIGRYPLSWVDEGNLSGGMKNIPSPYLLSKGGSDVVNALSLAPLRKGGADEVSRGVDIIH